MSSHYHIRDDDSTWRSHGLDLDSDSPEYATPRVSYMTDPSYLLSNHGNLDSFISRYSLRSTTPPPDRIGPARVGSQGAFSFSSVPPNTPAFPHTPKESTSSIDLNSLASVSTEHDELTDHSDEETQSRGSMFARRRSTASAISLPVPNSRPRWRKFKSLFQKSGHAGQSTDLQHEMFMLIHGRLFHSPLAQFPPRRALDIGTGRGTWAMQFANEFPSCHVIATDVHPFENWAPFLKGSHGGGDDDMDSGAPPLPNLTFNTATPSNQWGQFNQPFDFIHARYLSYATDHPALFRSSFENLNPGGWVEFHEWVLCIRSSNGVSKGRGDALERWAALVAEGARRQGRDVCAALKFKPMLRAAGFENIVQIKYDVPMGPWVQDDPDLKRLGEMAVRHTLMALRPFTMAALVGGLEFSVDEVDDFLVDVKRDMGNSDVHQFASLMVTFCQKPDPLAPPKPEVTSPTSEDERRWDPAGHIPIWSET